MNDFLRTEQNLHMAQAGVGYRAKQILKDEAGGIPFHDHCNFRAVPEQFQSIAMPGAIRGPVLIRLFD